MKVQSRFELNGTHEELASQLVIATFSTFLTKYISKFRKILGICQKFVGNVDG